LIWTPMKIAPATAALTPAARVSFVVVMVMTLAPVLVPLLPGCPALSRTLGTGVVSAHHHVM
jgi:hypothetical protein